MALYGVFPGELIIPICEEMLTILPHTENKIVDLIHHVGKSSLTLRTSTLSIPGTLENSEDPDEMPHNAAFHQGIHCLLRQNRYSEKEIHFCLEIKICESSI